MILVHGGTFEMGSNDQEQSQPIHGVSLSTYYISKYEITQQQWDVVMGDYYNLSSHANCQLCPVESVSWDEAQQFTRKLSEVVGKSYRLPTEAEWEYAARGGQSSKHYKYSGSNNSSKVGWVEDVFITDDVKTRPVGHKEPNELGIYDMTGNVMELCGDWYDSLYYKQKVENNPAGPANGKYKVCRGGSYLTKSQWSTVTARHGVDTNSHWKTLGFRIVRDYERAVSPNAPGAINGNR
jgi:formylglycine-generating enzyme required for sulfatase activity